ncbi:peptidase M56 family protein [Arthrobacter sp. D5-1]|uniref:peptidase M56 family protein n=1 Tax=Arthrobacter sp. D5-1 TaxID=1477518 RepID=UPI001A9960AC|nr:peptidase M56 family protein [Arthrobacter sp. D5-1]QSZ47372.1 peptidase M56 family protein [Arthrobacter sp. D5-1]
MNELRVDPNFSRALRGELVSRVEQTTAGRTRKRARLWIGAGVFAGVGLLGGVGATAAGLFVVPGAEVVTQLSTPVADSYQGTATVDLGEPPAGTTGIQIDFWCLTEGHFQYQDGSSIACSADDAGTPHGWSGYLAKLAPGQHSVTYTTAPESRWRLTARYVSTQLTEWATNGDGTTYGMENENGSPDMIAVMATNGKRGYAYTAHLNEANGHTAAMSFKSPEEALAWQEERKGQTFHVPVYEADGKSVIGEFEISDGSDPSAP